jgi:hypothetical protein
VGGSAKWSFGKVGDSAKWSFEKMGDRSHGPQRLRDRPEVETNLKLLIELFRKVRKLAKKCTVLKNMDLTGISNGCRRRFSTGTRGRERWLRDNDDYELNLTRIS